MIQLKILAFKNINTNYSPYSNLFGSDWDLVSERIVTGTERLRNNFNSLGAQFNTPSCSDIFFEYSQFKSSMLNQDHFTHLSLAYMEWGIQTMLDACQNDLLASSQYFNTCATKTIDSIAKWPLNATSFIHDFQQDLQRIQPPAVSYLETFLQFSKDVSQLFVDFNHLGNLKAWIALVERHADSFIPPIFNYKTSYLVIDSPVSRELTQSIKPQIRDDQERYSQNVNLVKSHLSQLRLSFNQLYFKISSTQALNLLTRQIHDFYDYILKRIELDDNHTSSLESARNNASLTLQEFIEVLNQIILLPSDKKKSLYEIRDHLFCLITELKKNSDSNNVLPILIKYLHNSSNLLTFPYMVGASSGNQYPENNLCLIHRIIAQTYLPSDFVCDLLKALPASKWKHEVSIFIHWAKESTHSYCDDSCQLTNIGRSLIQAGYYDQLKDNNVSPGEFFLRSISNNVLDRHFQSGNVRHWLNATLLEGKTDFFHALLHSSHHLKFLSINDLYALICSTLENKDLSFATLFVCNTSVLNYLESKSFVDVIPEFHLFYTSCIERLQSVSNEYSCLDMAFVVAYEALFPPKLGRSFLTQLSNILSFQSIRLEVLTTAFPNHPSLLTFISGPLCQSLHNFEIILKGFGVTSNHKNVLEISDGRGFLALTELGRAKRHAAVDYLLQLGIVNPNIRDSVGFTVADYSCLNEDYETFHTLLKYRNIHWTKLNHNTNTSFRKLSPIHIIAVKGNLFMMSYLLSTQHLNIDYFSLRDGKDRNIAHHAAHHGHFEFLLCLSGLHRWPTYQNSPNSTTTPLFSPSASPLVQSPSLTSIACDENLGSFLDMDMVPLFLVNDKHGDNVIMTLFSHHEMDFLRSLINELMDDALARFSEIVCSSSFVEDSLSKGPKYTHNLLLVYRYLSRLEPSLRSSISRFIDIAINRYLLPGIARSGSHALLSQLPTKHFKFDVLKRIPPISNESSSESYLNTALGISVQLSTTKTTFQLLRLSPKLSNTDTPFVKNLDELLSIISFEKDTSDLVYQLIESIYQFYVDSDNTPDFQTQCSVLKENINYMKEIAPFFPSIQMSMPVTNSTFRRRTSFSSEKGLSISHDSSGSNVNPKPFLRRSTAPTLPITIPSRRLSNPPGDIPLSENKIV